MPKRWFRFCYYGLDKNGREPLPHQLRDGDAALFLSEVLSDLGYRYAGPILNQPHFGERPGRLLPDGAEIRDLALTAGDLLVLTTRPPIDDRADKSGSKPILRSFTELEGRVLARAKEHLPTCSRKEIEVASHHAARWEPVARNQHVRFEQYMTDGKLGASSKQIKAKGKRSFHAPECDQTTLAYLIYEPEIWREGPGLLNLFGLGGTETMAWAYFLATRKELRRLICQQPFVMAQITEDGRPKRPQTIAFVERWDVRLLTTPGD